MALSITAKTVIGAVKRFAQRNLVNHTYLNQTPVKWLITELTLVTLLVETGPAANLVDVE